jgi:hypothetical protein
MTNKPVTFNSSPARGEENGEKETKYETEKGGSMKILETAIAAGRFDLAAHALVLATIKIINSGATDATTLPKIRRSTPKTETR